MTPRRQGTVAPELPALAAADGLAVPSGRPVTLLEVVADAPADVPTWHFRFTAPWLPREIDYAALEPDIEYLCNAIALPALAEAGASPERIVISLSDRPTEFGQPAPEAVQVFESYSIGDGACQWEPF